MPSTTKNPDLSSGPLAHDGDEPDPNLAATASHPALESSPGLAVLKDSSPDQKKPSPQPGPYSAKSTLEISQIAGTPIVWADEDKPFTGPQVKALLDENERLRAAVPNATRVLELEAALDGARREQNEGHERESSLLKLHEQNVEELRAHREYIKDKAQTKTFEKLMERAMELGASNLAFEVTLAEYFPYPSTKKSWACVAIDEAGGGPILGAEGRSGEEALREVVLRLEDRKP